MDAFQTAWFIIKVLLWLAFFVYTGIIVGITIFDFVVAVLDHKKQK